MDYERDSETEPGAVPAESDTSQPLPEEGAAGDDAAAAEATPTADAAPGGGTNGTVGDDTTDAAADERFAAAEKASMSGMDTSAWSGEAPGFEASTRDFGSDADVLDDAFSTNPAPPEWPAADLAAHDETAADDATAQIAAAYAAAGEETDDVSDDSDAPVQMDDALPAAAMDANVKADVVNLTQGGAQNIEATTVTLSQGGAGRVNADEMSVEMGGVGLARANNLKLGSGASAFAVVADEATIEEGSTTFLVVSRSFGGDVQPTIDWRAAMAFGAGLGLVIAILRRIR